MTVREKILKALSICLPETDAEGEYNCGMCPYNDRCRLGTASLPVAMIEDIRRVMREQELMKSTPEAEWHLFMGRRGATCSYCKYTFDDVYDAENYDGYCRHCGAKMVKIRTVN